MARRPRSEIAEDIRLELHRGDSIRPEIEKRLETFTKEILKPRPAPSAAMIRSRARKCRIQVKKLQRELVFFPFTSIFRTQLDALNALDKGLETIVTPKGIKGPAPRFDGLGAFCADYARAMIVEFSKQRPSGTERGSFRTIASLIYEDATGLPGRNLKRACDAVLKSWNYKNIEADPNELSPFEWNEQLRSKRKVRLITK